MREIIRGNGIGKPGQFLQHLRNGAAQLAFRPAGPVAGQFARIRLFQPGQAIGQDLFAGTGGGFAVAREIFKMLGELVDLEQDRARVFIVEQHQVKHCRQVRQQVVTRAERDGTVRHLQHGFEQAGILRLG